MRIKAGSGTLQATWYTEQKRRHWSFVQMPWIGRRKEVLRLAIPAFLDFLILRLYDSVSWLVFDIF